MCGFGGMQGSDDPLDTAQPRSSVLNISSSAFSGDHSFRATSPPHDDYDELMKEAMRKAAEHPDSHRMAVLPSKNRSRINMLDVNKLTKSKKNLLVTQALESTGQDNEILLQKIRARQNRSVHDSCRITQLMLTASLHSKPC